MTRFIGAVGVAVVLLLVMLFARWNSAERVNLDVGVHIFYDLPLTFVAFGSLFLGMFVMLVAGIHADLKVRKFLRERLAEEDRQERARIDLAQQDLFIPTLVEKEGEDG